MMTLSSLETLGIACAYIGNAPLAHICNWSLDTGTFPSRLKFSIIRPIFKKGDNSQWRTQEFCPGGMGSSTNSVEDRENGDLGAVAP
jgi:hypothetical protein